MVLGDLAIFNEQLLDFVVVDDRRISPGALAEASLTGPRALQAHAAGECSSTIREKLHVLEVSRIERVGGILILGGKTLVNSPLWQSHTNMKLWPRQY